MDTLTALVDVGSLAVSLNSLRQSFSQGQAGRHGDQGLDLANAQLEVAILQLTRYAHLGEAMEDWKNLHDGLHQLNRLLPNVVSEARSGTGKKAIDSTRRSWELLEIAVLQKYFGPNMHYAYVTSEFVVVTSLTSRAKLKWRDEVHDKCNAVSGALGHAQPSTADIQNSLQNLRVTVNHLIDAVNKELVEQLGHVVNMSRELREKLDMSTSKRMS